MSVINPLIDHQNHAEKESEVEEAKAKAEAETGFEALQTHQHTGHKHRAFTFSKDDEVGLQQPEYSKANLEETY